MTQPAFPHQVTRKELSSQQALQFICLHVQEQKKKLHISTRKGKIYSFCSRTQWGGVCVCVCVLDGCVYVRMCTCKVKFQENLFYGKVINTSNESQQFSHSLWKTQRTHCCWYRHSQHFYELKNTVRNMSINC